MLQNSKFAGDTDETDTADDADAGLVMSFRALVKTMQLLGNSADFERW
jgi:hypothetical protein